VTTQDLEGCLNSLMYVKTVSCMIACVVAVQRVELAGAPHPDAASDRASVSWNAL